MNWIEEGGTEPIADVEAQDASLVSLKQFHVWCSLVHMGRLADREAEKLREQWRAAEDAHAAALREGRAPNEVEALREKKERLKTEYLELLKMARKE